MAVTDRMLIGAIAGNPADYNGSGEYRYCHTCQLIFMTSSKKLDLAHEAHNWFTLPALNPDGSNVLSRAFQRFIVTWTPERQAELEKFAERKGWDMAMELRYGGGALNDDEATEWQKIVNARLDRLMQQVRQQIVDAAPSGA